MGFYTSAAGQRVFVYRKPRQASHTLPKNPPRHRIPVLYGYELVEEIQGGVIAPRTTSFIPGVPGDQPQSMLGKTLYCETDTQVYSGDLIVHEDSNGRPQVYTVEGEGENSYISPYSSIHGGREIFIQRVRYRQD